MSLGYAEFLETKRAVAPNQGKVAQECDLEGPYFDWQRQLVRWSVAKGRAALLADCGLGKTRMQLLWAKIMGERTLILAPLAVAQQTVREGGAVGIPVTYARKEADAPADGITITNYEMLDNFDPSAYGAVVLDESSCLKDFSGKTKAKLVAAFSDTKYRLCCTATPAPNDIAEIANHAEFLGIMTRAEMLAAFFVHKDDKHGGWQLKGHAREPFFRWLASWSMSLKRPSDLGYSDEGFELPPLNIEPLYVPVDYVPEGMLFFTGLKGITDRSRVRKATLEQRIAKTVELVQSRPDEQWLCWCGLNEEADLLARAIPGAVNVQGNDPREAKETALLAFARGETRVMTTKISVAGFGLNFQRAHNMVFVGLNDSQEQFYQGVRREWRFGQRNPVNAYIVLSDLEEEIYLNVKRKEEAAQSLAAELVRNVAEFERAEIGTVQSAKQDYDPTMEMRLPLWLNGLDDGLRRLDARCGQFDHSSCAVPVSPTP